MDFIHRLAYAELPGAVVEQARRLLLDAAGVAAGGSRTEMARIAREHALAHHGAGWSGGGARLIFDGRRTSVVGAAQAGAAIIDSLDGHDGHALAKGHVGAAVLPTLLAFADRTSVPSGQDLLTALVVGYEVGTRAGIALHRTAADYHSSGAWNALAGAAVAARALRLSATETTHALGIAEYSAPRAPMMRCIDEPSMVKDSSMWGAAAGASAALLAQSGFTGAHAATVRDPELRLLWADLGQRWRILEHYLKPFPVCRWAHPAIQAALELRSRHELPAEEVDRVDVRTFHHATRLASRHPKTTEEAQYSLPFAVALGLVHGRVTADLLADPTASTPDVMRLCAGMRVEEAGHYTALFPAQRLAEVTIRCRDGSTVSSGPTAAPGDPEHPLSEAEVSAKFHALAGPVLGPRRCDLLAEAVAGLPGARSATELLDLLLEPAASPASRRPGSARQRGPG